MEQHFGDSDTGSQSHGSSDHTSSTSGSQTELPHEKHLNHYIALAAHWGHPRESAAQIQQSFKEAEAPAEGGVS